MIQSSADAAYLARHVGLNVGLPVSVGALTLNRLCGSGFQSVISGAQEILAGDASVVLAGGTENMSQAPFAVRGTRFGTVLGKSVEFEVTGLSPSCVPASWTGLMSKSNLRTPCGRG